MDTEQRQSKFSSLSLALRHTHFNFFIVLRDYKPLNFVILLFEDIQMAKTAHTKHRKIHVLNKCKGERKEQQNQRIIGYIISHVNFFYPFRFLRSVAYRQFVRLVWEFVGKSNRLPLPCCVYNAIRSAFPTADHQYHGYEEEDDNEV